MDNIYAVTVPKWGIEMQEGTIVSWHFKEGDAVSKGDDLIDIETDKIVNTMEAPTSGVLRRRIVAEDETLRVGALLGVIATTATNDADIDTFITHFKPADAAFAFADEAAETVGNETATVTKDAPQAATKKNEKPRISPAAARLAKQLGVDISQVSGTGRGGRISSEDIEQYANNQSYTKTASTDAAAHEVITMSAMRKMISRKLVAAKQNIPHFYLSVDIDMDAALHYRQTVNTSNNSQVSVNDIVVRACVLSLQAIPQVNIHVQHEEIHQFEHVNIAIAVSTDDGLVTPVVQQAENLNLLALSERTKDLRLRARNNTLEPSEMRHGTFTVSNLGMFGIKEFQGIINPPQGALLAVSRATRQLIADGDSTHTATIMNVSLSCDHRAIDGVLGARFLEKTKALVESPNELVGETCSQV